jgi:hypothetical protein
MTICGADRRHMIREWQQQPHIDLAIDFGFDG